MTFASKAVKFFLNLKVPKKLPENINVLNPYITPDVKSIVEKFFFKFYDDNRKRILIIGINPGRFGGGITGIAFTDPIALEEHCGIKNSFIKKPELSSKFVYSFINEYGGVKKFYSDFFISALFPLALLNNGKNYNYYDSKELYTFLKPQLISSLKKQFDFGIRKESVVCLGKKNSVYLNILNDKLKLFKEIIVLEHPRYIMQYRLKEKNKFVKKYLNVFNSLLN